MGLTLGGIATPLPRDIYGETGTAVTHTLPIAGLGVTDMLQINGVWHITAGSAGTLTIRINDGSDHDFTIATGSSSERYWTFKAFIDDAFQIYAFEGITANQAPTTTAVVMNDIVSVTVFTDAVHDVPAVQVTVLNAV